MLGTVLIGAMPRALAQAADPLAAVAQLVREGHDERAFAELELLRFPPPGPERVRLEARARYLKARLLEGMGKFESVAETLPTELDQLPARVRDDVRRRRAWALARTGQCALARAELDEHVNLDPMLRALSGECALATGYSATAIERLRPFMEASKHGLDPVAARVAVAEAMWRQGRAGASIGELRTLLASNPEHPAAGAIESQLTSLGAKLEFGWEQRLERAQRWLELARPRQALSELDAATPPSSRQDLARWLHTRGMALYRTRAHYRQAARVLARAARLGGPFEIRDAFHAARALSRSDRNQAAVTAYRRLVRRYPNSRWAAHAEYLAAWLALRSRVPRLRPMQRFVSGPRAKHSSQLAREGLWQLAFAAYEARRYRRAIGLFERYARTSKRALVRARGLYWSARARQRRGDRRGAIEAFRSALTVQPLHWYALLARARLKQLGRAVGSPVAAPESKSASSSSSPLSETELPRGAAFYRDLGLTSDAVRALRAQEAALRRRAPPGRDTEALVLAYARLGEVVRPLELVLTHAREGLSEPPRGRSRWVWQAAHPRPYEQHVVAAERRHRLPADLLYAIMRQESGFAPEVVSYANAIGLLQLIPATAKKVAATLGVAYERERMFEPAFNIRLGAQLCARLHAEFRGQAVLVIAAYNAGSHRVRGWFKRARRLDTDLFVERIPIDQTRNYVRRVVSHWARYRYLAEPGRWPSLVPATVTRQGWRPRARNR